MAVSTLHRIEPTRVELEFEVPAVDFERAKERAFRELVRDVRMPGFRPGKVPRKVFEANYGTASIDERARDAVLGDAYAKALEENGLEPVERAEVEQVETPDGADVRFKATFDVRPEIALGEYTGLTRVEPDLVTDAEVDEAIEQLRRSEAELVPVDRQVAAGDVPTLDYEGRIDGEPFDGGSATNRPTEMSGDRFIPGFVDGIVGMRAGETKDVTATFPADYANGDYAGKTAVFTVTVHDVKVPELPSLDDEFALRFAKGQPGATLDGLRGDVRARMERSNLARARQVATSTVLERLREAHTFDLPRTLVEREIDALIDDSKAEAKRAGMSWPEFLEATGKSEGELRETARPDAERRVKTGLLLETIARKENITATERDLDAELAGLSVQYGRPKAQILEMVRPNIQTLIQGIVRSKTLDFLVGDGGVEASRVATS